MQPVFSHDEQAHQFVVTLDGRQGSILYLPLNDNTVDFQSTYIPVDMRQRGLGSQLVRYALRWAREHHLKVVPSCWFVRAVLEQDAKASE